MSFQIVLQRQARIDIWSSHRWIARQAPVSADRWLSRLQEKMKSLEDSPERCPVIAERQRLAFVVRELLFGRQPHVFRIVFTIDGTIVRVLRVRRGARRALTRRELEDAFRDDEPTL